MKNKQNIIVNSHLTLTITLPYSTTLHRTSFTNETALLLNSMYCIVVFLRPTTKTETTHLQYTRDRVCVL